jgi:hypothetical protein
MRRLFPGLEPLTYSEYDSRFPRGLDRKFAEQMRKEVWVTHILSIELAEGLGLKVNNLDAWHIETKKIWMEPFYLVRDSEDIYDPVISLDHFEPMPSYDWGSESVHGIGDTPIESLRNAIELIQDWKLKQQKDKLESAFTEPSPW